MTTQAAAVACSRIMTSEELECVRCGCRNPPGATGCRDCGWPFTLGAWADFERPPYRITLDTGCINARAQHDDLNLLESWGHQGRLLLQRSDAMLAEMKGDARVVKAAALPSHPGVFTLGVGRLGGPDVLAGPDMKGELEATLFPTTSTLSANQRHDVEHLRSHVRTGGDVFVTLNPNDFISRGRQERLRSVGIWVMSPNELVGLLLSAFRWT